MTNYLIKYIKHTYILKKMKASLRPESLKFTSAATNATTTDRYNNKGICVTQAIMSETYKEK
jgi:hypothetical protein